MTPEQLVTRQQRLRWEDDVLDAKTADDEISEDDREENETAEDKLLQGVVAASLADLLAEKELVRRLLDLAKQVHDTGQESKFEKLREIITDLRLSLGLVNSLHKIFHRVFQTDYVIPFAV